MYIDHLNNQIKVLIQEYAFLLPLTVIFILLIPVYSLEICSHSHAGFLPDPHIHHAPTNFLANVVFPSAWNTLPFVCHLNSLSDTSS